MNHFHRFTRLWCCSRVLKYKLFAYSVPSLLSKLQKDHIKTFWNLNLSSLQRMQLWAVITASSLVITDYCLWLILETPLLPLFPTLYSEKFRRMHQSTTTTITITSLSLFSCRPEPTTAANLVAVARKCMITIEINHLQVIYVCTVDEDLKFQSSRELQHGLSPPPPPPTSHVRVPPHQGVDNKDKISGVSRRVGETKKYHIAGSDWEEVHLL